MGIVDDAVDFFTGGSSGDDSPLDRQQGSGSTGSSGGDTIAGTPFGGDDTGSGLSLPDWLTDYAGVFKAFGSNPAGFILGAVLSALLGGLQTLVSALINALLFLALGSDYTISATGTLGIADIPVFAASLLAGSAGRVAGAFTTVIREFNRAAVGVATTAGPLSPVVYAGILAVVMVASAWALRTLIGVVADAVPGLEGIIG